MSETIHSLLRARRDAGQGLSPEAVLGSAFVEIVRRLLRDEFEARLEAERVGPISPWMTPPAAARVSGVPVKSIRAWLRSGRIPKRIRNSSADPKQVKYLVNVDDVVAVAEQGAADASTGDGGRIRARAEEILAARAARER